MKQHTCEAFSTTAIGWTPLTLMGIAMPPRDPDEETRRTKTRMRKMMLTNQRSCASRTKTRLARVWQSAL